jgi:hypothetical protein
LSALRSWPRPLGSGSSGLTGLARSPLARRLFVVAIYALVIAGCSILAYWRMFGGWATFDDEGFFVYSLKAFVDGHALYTSVYSEFGPFYYLLFGALFKVTGIAVTEEAGRFLTLSLWILTSLAFGLVAHRWTRSLWIGVATMLSIYVLLECVTRASMHAQILVCVLTAACAGVILLWLPRSERAAPVTLGALVAALALTKINLGGFAVIGIGFATFFAGPVRLRRRVLLVPAACAFILLGPVLMNADWDLASARGYAGTVALSTLALTIAAWPRDATDDSAPSSRFAYWLLGGFVVTVLALLVVTLAFGTTLGAWFSETIVVPSHQAAFANRPLPLSLLDVVVGIDSVAVALLVRVRGRLLAERWPTLPVATGLARFVAGLAIVCPVLDPDTFAHWACSYVFAWPFLWLIAMPPAAGRFTGRLPRVAIASFAISQSLMGYPFAASEGLLAGLTLVLCGAICLGDGLTEMRSAAATPWRGSTLISALSAVLVVTAAWGFYENVELPFAPAKATYWSFDVPLHGIGTGGIRVANPWAAGVNSVVAKLRTLRCQALMEIPGLYSFNLWTNIPTPSLQTGQQPYWSALSSGQQRQVLNEARRTRRLCLVTDYGTARLYTPGGPANGGPVPKVPLIRFLESDFNTVANYGEWHVAVRKGFTR